MDGASVKCLLQLDLISDLLSGKRKHSESFLSCLYFRFEMIYSFGERGMAICHSGFFRTIVKRFSEFYFTAKFWVFKLKMRFRMVGKIKISAAIFFAKKMAEWSRQALLHGTQCRFMQRELRFIFCGTAAKCFIKNAWRWSSSISFCYEAFSVSLQIWSIRFAHMM